MGYTDDMAPYEVIGDLRRTLDKVLRRETEKKGRITTLESQLAAMREALVAAQAVIGVCDCIIDPRCDTKRRYYELRDKALGGEEKP